MAKDYKTILLRDIPEDVVKILNEVGEKQTLKNGTDIILYIIRTHPDLIATMNGYKERFFKERTDLQNANWDKKNLQRKLTDILGVVNRTD